MVRSLRARNTHRHENQAIHNTGGEIYTHGTRAAHSYRSGAEGEREEEGQNGREREREEEEREVRKTREEEKRSEAREQDERWNDGDEVEEATADDASGTSVVSRE